MGYARPARGLGLRVRGNAGNAKKNANERSQLAAINAGEQSLASAVVGGRDLVEEKRLLEDLNLWQGADKAAPRAEEIACIPTTVGDAHQESQPHFCRTMPGELLSIGNSPPRSLPIQRF